MAYLKIIKYFKIFACETPERDEKNLFNQIFFLVFVRARVFRGQTFLVFKAIAIFRPLSNEFNPLKLILVGKAVKSRKSIVGAAGISEVVAELKELSFGK